MTEEQINQKCVAKSKLYLINVVNTSPGIEPKRLFKQISFKLNAELTKYSLPRVEQYTGNNKEYPAKMYLENIKDDVINDFAKYIHESKLYTSETKSINNTESFYNEAKDYFIMKSFLENEFSNQKLYSKVEITEKIENKINRKFKIQNSFWKKERSLNNGTVYPAIIFPTDNRGIYENPFYKGEQR